jgi:hypothetical protein
MSYFSNFYSVLFLINFICLVFSDINAYKTWYYKQSIKLIISIYLFFHLSMILDDQFMNQISNLSKIYFTEPLILFLKQNYQDNSFD